MRDEGRWNLKKWRGGEKKCGETGGGGGGGGGAGRYDEFRLASILNLM